MQGFFFWNEAPVVSVHEMTSGICHEKRSPPIKGQDGEASKVVTLHPPVSLSFRLRIRIYWKLISKAFVCFKYYRFQERLAW